MIKKENYDDSWTDLVLIAGKGAFVGASLRLLNCKYVKARTMLGSTTYANMEICLS